MWGFSKKRFLVTVTLSLIIFFISAFIQIYDFEDWKLRGFLNLSSCSGTGYPIKVCLYNSTPGLLISISLINIIFWFLIISFLYSTKRIIIGISAFLTWVMTLIIQKQQAGQQCFGDITWFRVTGYPIAECISKEDKGVIFAVYLVNITFWFLVISLIHKFIITLLNKQKYV